MNEYFNEEKLTPKMSLHQDVSTTPFCLLVNSPWPLVLSISLLFLFLSVISLYCWKGAFFSWSHNVFLFLVMLGIAHSLHFWFSDLMSEFYKKYEILLMVLFVVFFLFIISEALLFMSFFWATFHSLSSPGLGVWPGEGFYIPDPTELTFTNTLLLSNAAVSLGGAFVSMEICASSLMYFSLFSFVLALTFMSLQMSEFSMIGLNINDSVYSSVFFFLTGLHFFHLLLGLFLLSLFFWGQSFIYQKEHFFHLSMTEIHLYYNLQLFYWHFLELLWLGIYLTLYGW